MSNRMFHRESYGLEPKPVVLQAKITIGSTGAPTLTRGKGIASVVRNSAGKYTVTLQDTYQVLLSAVLTTLTPSTGIPTAPEMALISEAVSNSTPTVVFQTSGATSSSVTTLAATDPASGDILYLTLTLSDSTAL